MNSFLSSLIAFLSALIGVIVGVIVAKRNVYAETVSRSRNAWLNDFREELSIFLGAMRRVHDSYGCPISKECDGKNNNITPCQLSEIINEAEKARYKLLTRLNMDLSKEGNTLNPSLDVLIRSVDFSNANTCSELHINDILSVSKFILESEWKKVKKEAKGKRD